MGTWNMIQQVSWSLVPALTPYLNAWGSADYQGLFYLKGTRLFT